MAKPIQTRLRRHSYKQPSNVASKTGLTRKGISHARKTGRAMAKGRKVKGYHSGVVRAKASLEYELGSFRALGGKTYASTRARKAMGIDYIKDREAFGRLFKRYGGEDAVMRRWLDGKVSTRFIEKPEGVADKIIKNRFRVGKKIAEGGTKDRMLENVSHAWNIEAVFERLTGKKFNKMKPGTGAREMEGLTVTHYKNGKAVLRYRGKSFDVTKRLNAILAG